MKFLSLHIDKIILITLTVLTQPQLCFIFFQNVSCMWRGVFHEGKLAWSCFSLYFMCWHSEHFFLSGRNNCWSIGTRVIPHLPLEALLGASHRFPLSWGAVQLFGWQMAKTPNSPQKRFSNCCLKRNSYTSPLWNCHYITTHKRDLVFVEWMTHTTGPPFIIDGYPGPHYL